MRKHSMVLELVLILMTGPALAADYDLSVDNHTPSVGSQITVALAIDNWAGTQLQSFDVCVKYDSSVLSVNSMQMNDTTVGGCFFPAFIIPFDSDNCVRLGGSVWPGTTCYVADDYVLGTVQFDVLDDSAPTFVCTGDCAAADDQPCSHNIPEYVEDDSGKQYPAEVCFSDFCHLDAIYPDPATVDAETTIAFTKDFDFCETHNLVWSDDCVNGDINPATGVFSAGATYDDEDCTVSVFDNANPNACSWGNCNVALHINALCHADFDSDGNVYPSDLSIFLDEYGRTDCLTNPPCQTDIEGDGNVYPSDLSIFLDEYGSTDCPVIP
jgi:hypothetical protein